jgi:hypothetical protein
MPDAIPGRNREKGVLLRVKSGRPNRAQLQINAPRPETRSSIEQQTTGGFMRRLFALFVSFIVLAVVASAQSAPPQTSADQPYTMEYYYKVRWGHQEEFLQLFKKNHLPLLKKEVEMGRILSIKIETPANHMTEDQRWDYRVTLVFKNSTVATTAFDETALKRQLFPDQKSYMQEEQRRFEVLLAHWDLPVTAIPQ